MPDRPTDLGPFRSMVGFAAGGYVALVSLVVSTTEGEGSLRNWIEFVNPDIGEFGLVTDWELPAGEAEKTLVYGYHVFSGNDIDSPFGSLSLINIALTLKDFPDENRTHLVLDKVFEPFASHDPGRTGHIRCEVYRGPPLADIITHLDSGIYDALGDSFDTVRTAFQYRRDGVIGLVGEFEQAFTVDSVPRRMRIRIPVTGDDDTPTFELI